MNKRSALSLQSLAALSILAILATACSKKEETAPQLAESSSATAPAGTSAPAGEPPKDDWSWADSATSGASGATAPVLGADPEDAPPRPIAMAEEPPAPPKPRPAAPKPRPAPRPAPQPEPEPEPEPAPAPKPEPVQVTYTAPAGTSLGFTLDQPLSSATSQVGETFTGTLTSDVTDGNGRVVLPSGTRLLGKITEAVPARKAEKKSFLAYELQQAQLPDGTLVDIEAGQRLEGKGWTKKDGAIIGGSAGGGALAGGLIGGDAKGAAIGAVIGGAIGSGVALSKKGEDVTVNAGESISLALDSSVSVERTEMVTPVTGSN